MTSGDTSHRWHGTPSVGEVEGFVTPKAADDCRQLKGVAPKHIRRSEGSIHPGTEANLTIRQSYIAGWKMDHRNW